MTYVNTEPYTKDMMQTQTQTSQQSTSRASKTYRVTGLHFRFTTADGTPGDWAALANLAVDAASLNSRLSGASRYAHGPVAVSCTRRLLGGYRVTVDVPWIEATGDAIARLAATFSG